FPTLLELAGISAEPAASLDGISFASALRTGSTPPREALYWHYPHYHPAGLGPSGAVLSGDWKLIESFEAGLTGQPDVCELFNLREAPGEKNNLSIAEPARTAALRAQLAAWRKSVQAQMPTLNPRYDPARAGELESVSAFH
ncbi:MAG TPA: hypothetical protein VEA63_01995, partial [Opitutus sp.]|nr:hypothetical protein [Opitutus sp.]